MKSTAVASRKRVEFASCSLAQVDPQYSRILVDAPKDSCEIMYVIHSCHSIFSTQCWHNGVHSGSL